MRGKTKKKNLKNILIKIIEGHKKAYSNILSERRERLKKLSSKESFQEFLDMLSLYYFSEGKLNEEVDRIRIPYLIRRRNILDMAGKIKNEKSSK